MLSCNLLRERIRQAEAEGAAVAALQIDIEPQRFLEQASDEQVVNAFSIGSLRSASLCKKLHKRAIPEVGTQNVFPNTLGYELNSAFWSAKAYTEFADKFGKPFEQAKAVLDFGCGTSRLLRYLVDFLPGPQYYGSEVNPENIAWGRSNFPEVEYIAHDPVPPTSCEAGMFDIIYAQSIFSHYEESLHWNWLKELHRLLKKDGLLMVTKEGSHLVERSKTEPDLFKKLCLDQQDANALWDKFDKNGYAFYTRYNKAMLEQRGINSDYWGTAFISSEYINRTWTPLFEILEEQNGAVGNRQDYVIMRRKS